MHPAFNSNTAETYKAGYIQPAAFGCFRAFVNGQQRIVNGYHGAKCAVTLMMKESKS